MDASNALVEQCVAEVVLGEVLQIPPRIETDTLSQYLTRHYFDTADRVYESVLTRTGMGVSHVFVRTLIGSAFRAAFGHKSCSNAGIRFN